MNLSVSLSLHAHSIVYFILTNIFFFNFFIIVDLICKLILYLYFHYHYYVGVCVWCICLFIEFKYLYLSM